MTPRIAAVVVTYNRKELLERCLRAMVNQTHPPDRIVLVDNASSDGTDQMLASGGWLARPEFHYVRLSENTGGAGGFATGIGRAAQLEADWIWVMDDDALPHDDALEKLAELELDPANIYGSVAVWGDQLSWPMSPIDNLNHGRIYAASALPKTADVLFVPFLGLMVSSKLVSRIGVPDAGFFIAADDVDYCLRARKAGARIILAGGSRIEHPPSQSSTLRMPWGRFDTLKLTPWKRYYDVRNRLLVARNHYGMKLIYQTIPGSFLRLFATLVNEPGRWQQTRAFFAGMLDGLRKKKGRRHDKWGLNP